VKDSLHVEMRGRMLILPGFMAETQSEIRFFLVFIRCIFSMLDVSTEILVN